jgi:DNA-binding response OmpR family regulator
MRRAHDEPKSVSKDQFADITVDFERFEVLRNGEKIDLTAMEFKLLRALLEHRGQVLSIDELLREVWGKDVFLTDRVIYTHINNLRSKIEEDPHNPKLLVSVRGIGYRFDG